MVVILLSVVGNAMNGESEDSSSPKEMGVVYDGDPSETLYSGTVVSFSLDDILRTAYKSTYGTDIDPEEHIHYMSASESDSQKIADEMEDNGYDFAICIPASLKEDVNSHTQTKISSYYSYSNGGLFSTVTSATGTTMINAMGDCIRVYLTADSDGADFANYIEQPLNVRSFTEVNGKVYSDLTPYQIYSAMMGQNMVVPIIVMIVIVMVGSIVISSMGSEKENKTLETLLTMPIKRTTIVSGKLLAAAIMGLVYGICYLAGMLFYSNGLTSGIGGSVNLSDYGLAMGATDWVILMVILFLSIFSALGICMILGAFTKNYKMAQTMTMPISGLAMLPMFVFMFTSWENLPGIGQAVMFIIPFSHPMMAMNNLIFDNTSLVVGGIIYLVLVDIAMIMVTVRIYNSDVLITGLGQSKYMKGLRKLFKNKEQEHEDRRDH